jgi:hypothetical protein
VAFPGSTELNILEKLASFETSGQQNGIDEDGSEYIMNGMDYTEIIDEKGAQVINKTKNPTFSTLNVTLARTGLASVMSIIN